MILPSLSIIIPNFNHGKHLPAAVEAIAKQPVRPFEIIIIDDGSTDNSIEVIQSLAAKYPLIRFFSNGTNRGVSYTLNRGIDLASGEYTFFPAADDEVLPGFFEKSLRLLAEYPHAGLSCTLGDWREVATGLKWYTGVGMANSPSYLSPREMVNLEKRNKFFIPNHTAILKRSALLEAGKFIPDLKSTSDWFAQHVIGFRHGICFVPEPLAIFNIHPNSYYKRIRRDPGGFGEILEHMVNLLLQPQYEDVAKLIKEGGSLYVFGIPMLKLLLSRPKYRSFLTSTFLRKNAWHCAKLGIKKIIPPAIGNLLLKAAGYHKIRNEPA